MASIESSRKSSMQEKVDKLLEQAGLQGSPFDTLSLQALQDYLADRDDNADDDTETKRTVKGAEPPLDQVDICGIEQSNENKSGDTNSTTPLQKKLFENMVSPLTMPAGISSPTNNSTTTAKQSVEYRMMEQLQLQTSLILDLQRKIEGLSNRVKELEHGGYAVRTGHSPMESEEAKPEWRFTPPVFQQVPYPPAGQENEPREGRDPAPVGEDRPQQEQRVFIQRQPQPPPNLRQPVVAPRQPAANQESRFARFIRIFGERRRRQAPNLEWGLVFKVVLMMAILFSRLGSDFQEMPAKFYGLGALLIGGFLFQTGYAQFLYKFFILENNAYRILVLNEDVPLEPPRPPRAGNRGQGEEDGWFDWGETFLGGRIAPQNANNDENAPDQERQQLPLLFRIVREIFLLLLSFVLSLFPMWHPQVPPPRPPRAPAAPVNEENNNENNGNINNANQQNNNRGDGPGVVRPPRDPAEPEEDED